MIEERPPYLAYWGKTFRGDAAAPESDSIPPHRLLAHHCLDVAAVCQVLLEKDEGVLRRAARISPIPWEQTLPWLLFFAALHDLGKFAPPFQHKVPELGEHLAVPAWPYACAERHTDLGGAAWRAHAKDIRAHDLSFGPDERDVLHPLAQAAFGHHGEPLHEFARGHESLRPVSGAVIGFMNDCAQHFLADAAPVGQMEQAAFRPLSWLFSGLLVLADWIASNEAWFPALDAWPSFAAAWKNARHNALDAVTASGVLLPPVSGSSAFHDILPHLPPEASPTPLQQFALERFGADDPGEHGPRLLIFEDLTGSGKTEAALLAAHGLMRHGEAGGLFAALPTMATANAMYARLADTYRALFAPDARPSLMLAHGARSVHDDFLGSIGLEMVRPSGVDESESGAACALWLADNRKKALLAPCGAGTLDQALLAVLPSRHQCLRLLGLSRSVLVADEVHAYDTYTGHLLERLLTFHAALGGSAVLLTATLPRTARERLIEAHLRGRALWAGDDTALPLPTARHDIHGMDFPLVTAVSGDHVEEIEIKAARGLRVDVEVLHDETAMVERLLAVREAGGCAVFVRNTVDSAVRTRQRLVDEHGLPPGEVLLFHARFAGADRQAIEARVLDLFGKDADPLTRRGKILVATQVVEQSLDLDFDLVLSDLAPMELLIQRAGRCQRHRDRFLRPGFLAGPRLLVLSPEPGEDVGASWLDELLPHTAAVYPVHGVLWRTARLCLEHGCFDLPVMARTLIENAYGNDCENDTPPGLAPSDDALWGKRRGERSLAERNALDFASGYCRESSDIQWDKDVHTPTRLGEETVQVRLICLENGALRLWAAASPSDRSMRACLRSEVRIAARRLAEGVIPQALRRQYADLMASLPDEGRWCTALVLESAPEQGPDTWRGAGKDGRGTRVVFLYDAELGLRLDA